MLQVFLFFFHGDHILVSTLVPPLTFYSDYNIRNSTSETGDNTVDVDDNRLGQRYMPLDNRFASLTVRQKDYKFLVEVLIGMPPKKQTLVLDIGSGLTWIQCYPLKRGFTLYGQKYNRSESKSFIEIHGTNEHCDQSKGYGSSKGGRRCYYEVIDPSSGKLSRGFLAREVIHMARTSVGPMQSLILFGCSDDNDKNILKGLVGNTAGVFGLGFGDSSYQYQFLYSIDSMRFAYCVPGMDRVNSLRFGDDIPAPPPAGAVAVRILRSASSHLRSKYKLELTGVSFEGKQLDFDVWNYECVIDTRARTSRIPRWMHQRLANAISGFFDRRGVARAPKSPGDHRVCYLVSEGFTDYPTISFHFASGDGGYGSMVLVSRHLFDINKASLVERKDVACFAIRQNRAVSKVVTIGVMQQMHTGFIFDLRANLLTFFADYDCANF